LKYYTLAFLVAPLISLRKQETTAHCKYLPLSRMLDHVRFYPLL